VAMHGGVVEARSEGANAGSEFVVRLPVLRETIRPATSTTMPEPFPPRRIMVVDDNHDAAETLSMLLTELGATVAVAHSGPEALEALDGFDPDAVLLDIGMPGMDGYEVSRLVRASSTHGDVLLIALTGWGQEDDRERSKRAGFDYHFVKPPDINRMRTILASRDARRHHEPRAEKPDRGKH